jgi:hypothetical protein
VGVCACAHACVSACACVRVSALRFAVPPSRPPQQPVMHVAPVTARCNHWQPGATWHAACAFVVLCCAAHDALRYTRRTDLATLVRAAHESDRVGTCPLHSRLSCSAARRVVGRASGVAAPVRHEAWPAQQKSAAGRSAVLASGASATVERRERAGGHGGQAGCFGQAGARILPSLVNASSGRGARRRQQSARARRPA